MENNLTLRYARIKTIFDIEEKWVLKYENNDYNVYEPGYGPESTNHKYSRLEASYNETLEAKFPNTVDVVELSDLLTKYIKLHEDLFTYKSVEVINEYSINSSIHEILEDCNVSCASLIKEYNNTFNERIAQCVSNKIEEIKIRLKELKVTVKPIKSKESAKLLKLKNKNLHM